MNSPCKDRDRKPNQRYRKSINICDLYISNFNLPFFELRISKIYPEVQALKLFATTLPYKLNIFPVFTDRM